jgi:hypothetical protein
MNAAMHLRRLGMLAALALCAVAFTADTASAQIGGSIRGAVERAAGGIGVDQLIGNNSQPITTGLEHARFAVDSLDNFSPHDVSNYRALGGVIAGFPVDSLDNMPLRSIADLQRTENGGFVLQPGFWEMHTQSYCLKAGTHGPGGGDGYLFAPPDGPAEDAVVAILRNSVNHPEISQQRIQTLLWAIIARAKFEDLSAEHKATASALLTPQQIAMLNRSALDLIPDGQMRSLMGRVPAPLRQIVEAEARLRSMLVNPASSFAQMEAVAVLTGAVGLGPGSRNVPAGRWSRHPDGYYVRYLPQGYSYTVTQLWVPEKSEAVGREFDPATHIAVPGNTARQRLAQSGRFHARDGGND